MSQHNIYPRFSMVLSIPPQLKAWWIDLGDYGQRVVRGALGHLPSLMNIQPCRDIIDAATVFWDEKRVMFRFGNNEMTPLLEEMGGYVENAALLHMKKKWQNCGMIIPKEPLSKEFVDSFGFRKGTMVFPKGTTRDIHTRLSTVIEALFGGIEGKCYTLMEHLQKVDRSLAFRKPTGENHILGHVPGAILTNRSFEKPNCAVQHPETDPYEEIEREARAKADENVAKEIRSLKEAFRRIQTHKGCEGLEYEDLWKDQAIRMKLFIRSLTGEALDWYTFQDPQKWHSWGEMAQEFMDRFRFNTETVPDRFYLIKLEKKSTETFKEYAMRWRAEAAKVQPLMAENEMTTLFVQSLKDATYYERLISVIEQKFSEVIRMRDSIEEGIKTGRITNLAALLATNKAIQSDSAKKKRDGVSAVMAIQERRPNQMLTYQYPSSQPLYYSQYAQVPQPYYQPPPAPHPVYHTQPAYYPPRAPAHQSPSQYHPAYSPQPQYQPQNHKIEALFIEGVIQLKGAPPNINNNPLPNYGDANVNMITIDEDCNLEGTIVPVRKEEKVESSAFIAPVITVQMREPIEVELLTPKPRITALVARALAFNTKAVFWNYPSDEKSKGKAKLVVETIAAGLTRSGRCYAPEEVARGAPSKENGQKKAVTEAEVEEFWRKMPTKESALVKVLNEAYVPAETSSEKFSAMVGEVLEAHKVSFHENELPPEGLGHNKALNITVKCRDKFISKVLIDEGSAVNICPVTTLRALGIDIRKLRDSHVRVKGFDGAQRGVVGEIDLALEIRPVEFVVEFQVMDISASYNLLIERPWIHMAGAIPSTLHQNLKFVWNHQKVVIHGEGNNSIYPENSIPVIESVERLDGSIFHIKETMCTIQAEGVKLPRVLMMVAWEMLKNGFKPGRGLRVNLDGIVEPIQLPGQKDTFGLGYEPTLEEI
ncbi:uncharacterized protein LOC132606099 [Lycium barbarum]|uniref:uncharacterized protein LOC132606099 n=1 Tax=Lycium barbarum TaxID=112863 RepID=UPI00293E0FD6|nr:uncharacterized protein LOC132606099 [Lycium barbarum]